MARQSGRERRFPPDGVEGGRRARVGHQTGLGTERAGADLVYHADRGRSRRPRVVRSTNPSLSRSRMSPVSRREFLAAAAAATTVHVAPAAPPRLTIAPFAEEVTPPIGHPCMGGGIAPAKEIVDPLYATGFVLLGAGEPIVVVAVDWCEIRNDAYDRWRDALAEAAGTKRERVLVSCLHQHDAPIADLTAQRLLDDAKAKGAICDRGLPREDGPPRGDRGPAGRWPGRSGSRTSAPGRRRSTESRRTGATPTAAVVRHNRMSATRDPKIRDAEEGLIDPWLKTLTLLGRRPAGAGPQCVRHAPDELLRQGRGVERLRRPGPQAPAGGRAADAPDLRVRMQRQRHGRQVQRRRPRQPDGPRRAAPRGDARGVEEHDPRRRSPNARSRRSRCSCPCDRARASPRPT